MCIMYARIKTILVNLYFTIIFAANCCIFLHIKYKIGTIYDKVELSAIALNLFVRQKKELQEKRFFVSEIIAPDNWQERHRSSFWATISSTKYRAKTVLYCSVLQTRSPVPPTMPIYI